MPMVSLPGLKVIIDSMSRDRNLPKQAVQNALKEALLKGYERYRRMQSLEGPSLKEDYFDNFNVELDLAAEGFRIVAAKTVVAEVTQPDFEIAVNCLPKNLPHARLGETVIVDVTPDQREFGRLAALQTKQVLTQKLQEQQCQMIKDEFQALRGTVVNGRVLRLDRKAVIFAVTSGVDKPEVQAELPNYEKLHHEQYIVGSTMKVYLKKVYDTPRQGPTLRVSRATTGLVAGILTEMVPEIQQELVQIKGIVRDSAPTCTSAVSRSKIAIETQQPNLDAVAVCTGENGRLIHALSKELQGEKIEIILWSEEPVIFIANALIPAQVKAVEIVDAEALHARVSVAPDQLALALGPEEQNVKLASRLTGWKIDIITEASS